MPAGRNDGLQEDLVRIVYGYGDNKVPLQESIELLEHMVHGYIREMCRQAYEVALLCGRAVKTEDLFFLVRKDLRRYKRLKDLLEADEELKEARNPKLQESLEGDTRSVTPSGRR